MKKKKLSLLISTGAALLGATAISAATAVSLASCTSTTTSYDKSIAKQLYNAYNSEYSAAMGNQMYYQLTAENQPKVTTVTQNYLSKVNSAIDAVGDKFGLDEQIWLRSFKFYLQTKLKLLQSNIRYVIVDDYDMLSMTNYATTFQSQIAKAASNYYYVDEETSEETPLSYDTVLANLNGVNQYINEILANLKEGLADGTTWSGVMAKHTIGSILQQLYTNDLNTWVSKTGDRGDLKTVLKGTLFTNDSNKDNWIKLLNATQQSTINDLLVTVQTSLDNLTKYLMNDYFNGIKYGNVYSKNNKASTDGTMSLKFEVSENKKPNEEDNGFSYTANGKTYYISGLGLDANDLTVKDIGIGFSSKNGQAIYKALLQKHSNVEDADPAEQYKFGDGQVDSILSAMKSVANIIADIHVGSNAEWKATYMYDQDSSGDEYGSEKVTDSEIRSSNGNLNMTNFFKWLNGDQWFNGRDMTTSQFPSIDGKTELKATGEENTSGTSNKTAYTYTPYWTNKDLVASVIGYVNDKDANVTTTTGDAGNLYVKYIIKGLSAATIQSSDTITASSMAKDISAAAAYIGSSHAVSQYLTYKNDVTPHVTAIYKNTPIYWTLRSGVGGAAYANGGEGESNWVDKGSGGFYLDSNPYFGLQKWSMSTLTNHEALGHVMQFAYADAHPADDNVVSLDSNAYAEGWGLFSEWLGTQLGIYGQPTQASATLDSNNNVTGLTNVLALPKFGTKSQTTNIALLSKDYANGAYYIVDKSSSTANTDQANSQKYYDALQYFGFLNERQLRAMRIAVDVGLHAGTKGDFATGTGYSLNDARNYLRSNSGLGIDDVNRETKRYLEYIGQATSYYNGVDKIESYFLKAKALYEENNRNSTFMNWEDTAATQANTQDFFDLILRNGDVQLPALSWAVDKYLSEKYPTTPTTNL